MNTIEDLIEFNKKLSLYYLIFRKYKWKWLFVGFIPAILGFGTILGLIIFRLILQFNVSWAWLIFFSVISLLSIIFSAKYLKKKSYKVIESVYKNNIELTGDWDYKTLTKIRIYELKNFINNPKLLTDQNIPFLIESIKRENENKQYNYSFLTNTVIILISVYFGAILGSLGGFIKDFNEYLLIFKPITGLFLLIAIVAWYAEFNMLKYYILEKRKKENRLIRILENILVEEYAK